MLNSDQRHYAALDAHSMLAVFEAAQRFFYLFDSAQNNATDAFALAYDYKAVERYTRRMLHSTPAVARDFPLEVYKQYTGM